MEKMDEGRKVHHKNQRIVTCFLCEPRDRVHFRAPFTNDPSPGKGRSAAIISRSHDTGEGDKAMMEDVLSALLNLLVPVRKLPALINDSVNMTETSRDESQHR